MHKFFTSSLLLFCLSFSGIKAWAQPTNDSPCEANLIAVDAGFVLDSTFDATVDPGEVVVDGIQGPEACYISWCDGPILDGSVWWTFVAPSNGAVVITTCSENTGFDTQIAVWTSSNCSDYTTFEFVAASDDMPNECDSGGSIWATTLNIDGLISGATYYIQLDGFDAAEGYYDLSVSTGIPSTRINFVHNSADQTIQAVDIRVNNELVADDLAFQNCTGFIEVEAGEEKYITICDSESSDDSNPFYSITQDISSTENYVAIVYGIYAETGYTPAAPLQLSLYEGALENPLEAGFDDVLFFHGSTDAPVVDVELVDFGNLTVIDNAMPGSFASEGYLSIAVANYTAELNDENGNSLELMYCFPFALLGGNYALTVVASGFLDPSQNSDGLPFGIYVVDHFNGGFIPIETGPCPIAANDVPCDAVELIVNDLPYLSNNQWATIEEDEIAPPNLFIEDPEADCLTQWCDGQLNNSVWFKFIAPGSGEVVISTCHEVTVDTQIAVYTVTACDEYTTFEYIAANDDADGGCEGGSQFASTLPLAGLISDAVYYIQVDGWQGQSGDFEITVEGIVAVNEIGSSNWQIYPNPADQIVKFAGISGKAVIMIYDITGKCVKSSTNTASGSLDIADLPAGIYNAQLIQNGNSSYAKLIVE